MEQIILKQKRTGCIMKGDLTIKDVNDFIKTGEWIIVKNEEEEID